MKFIFYKIAENIAHGGMSHCKLHLVDSISKNILQSNVKLQIGTSLEDDVNNIFRVNGYFGEYIILRSSKINTHPSGQYLICKEKLIKDIIE